jgi:pyruvate decarboxylase
MYEEMAKQVTAATTVLWDSATATSEIDRVLNTMFLESRPGYLGLPVDVGQVPCSDEGLKTPIVRSLAPNNENLEKQVVEEIITRLNHASNPIIIVDGCKRMV